MVSSTRECSTTDDKPLRDGAIYIVTRNSYIVCFMIYLSSFILVLLKDIVMSRIGVRKAKYSNSHVTSVIFLRNKWEVWSCTCVYKNFINSNFMQFYFGVFAINVMSATKYNFHNKAIWNCIGGAPSEKWKFIFSFGISNS